MKVLISFWAVILCVLALVEADLDQPTHTNIIYKNITHKPIYLMLFNYIGQRMGISDGKIFSYPASLFVLFITIYGFKNFKLFTSWSIIVLFISFNTITLTTAAHAEECDCKAVGDSFIVTRLWNILPDSGLTAQNVIDEFESGFAPKVTKLAGFEEYTSAFTGDSSTVFFMNIFETQQQAAAAQAAAVTFVQESSVLNGKITPNQFNEANMDFFFSKDKCVEHSIKGKYLSTRLWKMTQGATLTPQDVVDEFESGFAPEIQKADGFLEYGGAVVDASETFFYNVFDTATQAAAANTAAATFKAGGVLSDQIEKVVFTQGLIGFDYTCATDNDFGDDDDDDDDSNSDSDDYFAGMKSEGVNLSERDNKNEMKYEIHIESNTEWNLVGMFICLLVLCGIMIAFYFYKQK
eukprot:299492_1